MIVKIRLTERRFWDLFIASFGALFFELLLVRWLPTTIYYLGYYKNCILFATFLGYGVGCATHYKFDRVLSYFGLPVALLVFGANLVENHIKIIPGQEGEFIWPQVKATGVEVPMLIILLVVFVVSALIMIPLGQLIGTYLRRFIPLVGYSINIGASLLGVMTFLLLGYLQLGPIVWFTIAFLPILYFTRGYSQGIFCNLIGLALVISIFLYYKSPQEYWSPYYKITLEEPHPLVNARLLSTNNNGHQVLYDFSPERMALRGNSQAFIWKFVESHLREYESAYTILQPESVLIVGGGTGNEAATALRQGVEKIHVVEIDPVIIQLGKDYHPERPYHDPRVVIINDDARHYMATTQERYDLIIFGLLDSTSYLSSMSNIRLDNYVYTLESFQQARKLLAPNGLLQVIYYAAARFVKVRIFLMIQEAFEQQPLAFEWKDYPSANVIFFAGPAIAHKSNISLPGLAQMFLLKDFSRPFIKQFISTDDWPFLNVLSRSIGKDYIIGLSMMIFISFFFIRFFVWSGEYSIQTHGPNSWLFFLQGVGFMLLETNTITRMALIMGSTWIVISVAIILVLLAALVSNYIVQRFTFPGIEIILVFLSATLLLNYFVDIHFYLSMQGFLRILLATFQVYLPILGSSLLFGRLFQQSKKSNFDFGINILGAVFGGILEYSSLIIGIRAIYLLVLVIFLGIALIFVRMVQNKRLQRP